MKTRFAPFLPVVALALGCTPEAPSTPQPVAVSYPQQIDAPTGRRLELEDYYRIPRVGSPRISPDGAWVAFTVSRPVEEDNSSQTSTWLVATDGSSEPAEVRVGIQSTTSPAWDQDGRLWVELEGATFRIVPGESARPTPVSKPEGLLSPDGTLRAILRDAEQEELIGPELSDFERRHADRFEGFAFDWMYFQRDGRQFPVPDPRRAAARHVVIAEEAGTERVLVEQDLRPNAVSWSPDSDAVAFVADSHFRDESTYGRSDIWVVPLEGELQRLTDDGHTYSGLQYSPDGQSLAVVRGFGTDMVIEQRLDHGGPCDLVLFPIGGGEPINLTADWDLMAGSPSWSADGQWLYFSAQSGGTSHLFRVAAAGGAVEQVTEGERRLGGISFDHDTSAIAYIANTFEAPGEIYVAGIDGSGERRLTSIHAGFLEEVSPAHTTRLNFSSADGTPVEGWLTYPYGYTEDGGPYPLIVHSHGGPHSAVGYGFNFKHQYFASRGYFVLTTNFRGSTGYGEDFKWATWGAWGDVDGQDVMAGVEHVLEHFPVDPSRVGATGHSYGGFMTNWLITQYPDAFAAAIPGAGISNWVSDYGTADIARTKETEFYGTPWQEDARNRLMRQSPLIYADRAKAATMFVHGEVDQRVPYEEAEQMYFALKKNGVEARMVIYKGMAHGIRGHWNSVHRAMIERMWFDRYLSAGETATSD